MTADVTQTAGPSAVRPRAVEDTITVLCVDDDPDYLDLIAASLSDEDDFEIVTETTPVDALDRISEVDCLVSDYDMPAMTGLELLSAVRDRDESLPFVLFTGSSRGDLADRLPESTWTEFLRKGDPRTTMPILAGRVRRLVDHHRIQRIARRTLTAMEATGDGLAVVDPGGAFSFVNRVFASRFGYAPDGLVGESWQTCFPDDEVDRLESTALRTVRDDWQWTGGCVAETADGDTFTTQARVAGLDDGSLIFCLSDASDQ